MTEEFQVNLDPLNNPNGSGVMGGPVFKEKDSTSNLAFIGLPQVVNNDGATLEHTGQQPIDNGGVNLNLAPISNLNNASPA